MEERGRAPSSSSTEKEGKRLLMKALTVFTALALELVAKRKMRQLKDKSTADGEREQFDMNDKRNRNVYIMCCGVVETSAPRSR